MLKPYFLVICLLSASFVGCIEEAAYRMGNINRSQLLDIAEPLLKSGYGEYLMDLLDNRNFYKDRF